MSAPYLDGGGTYLASAPLLGFAFGWLLERADMGHPKKLARQFYLRDLTVFKVLFSALITAMLGAFWLARAGVLELGRVYVPETYLLPQLAGGAVFGVGFVLAGLCPGTACVATASGRSDGVAAVLGMLAGVLAFALVPGLHELSLVTPRGPLTLPQQLGMSTGAVVFLVSAVALAGFAAAARLERRA